MTSLTGRIYLSTIMAALSCLVSDKSSAASVSRGDDKPIMDYFQERMLGMMDRNHKNVKLWDIPYMGYINYSWKKNGRPGGWVSLNARPRPNKVDTPWGKSEVKLSVHARVNDYDPPFSGYYVGDVDFKFEVVFLGRTKEVTISGRRDFSPATVELGDGVTFGAYRFFGKGRLRVSEMNLGCHLSWKLPMGILKRLALGACKKKYGDISPSLEDKLLKWDISKLGL